MPGDPPPFIPFRDNTTMTTPFNNGLADLQSEIKRQGEQIEVMVVTLRQIQSLLLELSNRNYGYASNVIMTPPGAFQQASNATAGGSMPLYIITTNT